MPRVNYKKLMQKSAEGLKLINKLAKDFGKYEMTLQVKSEVLQILRMSSTRKINILSMHTPKKAYAESVNSMIQISDSLYEIDLLTSDLMKKVNELPEKERKEFFDTLGIDPIEEENMGISPERHDMLNQMAAIAAEVIEESDVFYCEELEDYLDAI